MLLVLCRALAANGLWQLLPFAHLHWGTPHGPDDPRAVQFLLLLHLLGLAAAAVYFAVASVAHLLLRRRGWKAILLADIIFSTVIGAALVYAGMTASYPEARRPPDAVMTQATPLNAPAT